MKRNHIYVNITILSLLLLSACNYGVDKAIYDPSLKDLRIRIIDTIKVAHYGDGLKLLDQSSDKYAFLDIYGTDIIVTTNDGTILSKFNNTTLGSDGLGDAVYGMHFKDNSLLAVLSNKGYFIYNFQGKLKKRYLHPFDLSRSLYITGEYKLSYDKKRNRFLSLLTTSTDLGMDNPKFFDQAKHITTFGIDSQKYDWHVPYESDGSYQQDEYFTGEWGAHFDTTEDTLVIVWARDPIVYYYDLNSFKRIGSFKTDPEHFRLLVKFPFSNADGLSMKEGLMSFANSDYRKVILKGDTVITSYCEGLPKEFLDNITDLGDFQARSYRDQHTYIRVFVKGEKVARDFELPKEFPFLSVLDNGEILLGEESHWNSKTDGYRRFLRARIDYGSDSTRYPDKTLSYSELIK